MRPSPGITHFQATSKPFICQWRSIQSDADKRFILPHVTEWQRLYFSTGLSHHSSVFSSALNAIFAQSVCRTFFSLFSGLALQNWPSDEKTLRWSDWGCCASSKRAASNSIQYMAREWRHPCLQMENANPGTVVSNREVAKKVAFINLFIC